jgi:hypothetical protein
MQHDPLVLAYLAGVIAGRELDGSIHNAYPEVTHA